jgi:hypothetical protein
VLRAGRLGSTPDKGRRSFHSRISTRNLEPVKPPIEMCTGGRSLELMGLGYKVNSRVCLVSRSRVLELCTAHLSPVSFMVVHSSSQLLSCSSLADSFYPEDRGGAFPETSVFTRPTRCHIPEDCTLHSHHRENLKCYIALTGWTL